METVAQGGRKVAQAGQADGGIDFEGARQSRPAHPDHHFLHHVAHTPLRRLWLVLLR
jgi:hypothetical protein